jgi:predicted RNase H-like nuclease
MGTYHEQGYGGTRRRLVLKRKEEVDEEADNNSVDSLICASGS